MTFERNFYTTKTFRGRKRASDRRRMLEAKTNSNSREAVYTTNGGWFVRIEGTRLFVTSPDDDAAEMLRGVDQWTTRVVEEQGTVPLEMKLFPIIDSDGNSEFEVNNFADAPFAVWSRIKADTMGKLTLSMSAIWRSRKRCGYGVIVKPVYWDPV
ncbi:hypothetical protein T492DRAFT_1134105 [Pavlovales sp. CCMP2436]|nr:hypothetical protein T492DRAFT_1134105 [Pavlovales sp. CCMP2436]